MSIFPDFWPVGVLYLFLNGVSFTLMGWDKYKARKKRWRTPEKSFFVFAFFGGALGILLGMEFFRHKTKHNSFVYGIPLLLVWNIFVIYRLWLYL